MMLEDLLKQEREAILEAWRQVIRDSYPQETARFLLREQDQFANPVGHFIRSGTESVLDQILGDMDGDVIRATLDPLVRIRAVQDFKPCDALRFIFDLKQVVRDRVSPDMGLEKGAWELLEFESRIDRLALLAFEMYVRCRDRIGEIQVESIKRRYAVILKRMNMLDADPDAEVELGEGEA